MKRNSRLSVALHVLRHMAEHPAICIGGSFAGPSAAMQLGCAFDEGVLGPVIRVDDRKETTVPGVYAAGDAAGAMHDAMLASADGVLAGEPVVSFTLV